MRRLNLSGKPRKTCLLSARAENLRRREPLPAAGRRGCVSCGRSRNASCRDAERSCARGERQGKGDGRRGREKGGSGREERGSAATLEGGRTKVRRMSEAEEAPRGPECDAIADRTDTTDRTARFARSGGSASGAGAELQRSQLGPSSLCVSAGKKKTGDRGWQSECPDSRAFKRRRSVVPGFLLLDRGIFGIVSSHEIHLY